MLIKLESEVLELLCCPLCKSDLISHDGEFRCRACASSYKAISVEAGVEGEETVWDFRIHRPPYCIPAAEVRWQEAQQHYEDWYAQQLKADSLDLHLEEIDSVAEVYSDEFDIRGRVLDIGGSEGRLRHFIREHDVQLYLSVDPSIGLFGEIPSRKNLTKAYPSLLKPCNFLLCHAEALPLVNGAFDWVHMRSVLDHFNDPYVALREARRVLKPTGTIVLGLAIMEKFPSVSIDERVRRALRTRGLLGTISASVERIRDLAGRRVSEHLHRFSEEELIDLIGSTGFIIDKVHWQKPPYSYSIYLSASPKDPGQPESNSG